MIQLSAVQVHELNAPAIPVKSLGEPVVLHPLRDLLPRTATWGGHLTQEVNMEAITATTTQVL